MRSRCKAWTRNQPVNNGSAVLPGRFLFAQNGHPIASRPFANRSRSWRIIAFMDASRKDIRARLKAVPTKAQLSAMLDASTLSDAQREAVFLVYGMGRTRVRASLEMGVSLSCLNKLIASSYDKLG